MARKKVCLSGTELTKIFGLGQQKTVAVDNVDFSFYEGEVISIVGESGSGKSVTALSIMGLVASPPGVITGGASMQFAMIPMNLLAGGQKADYTNTGSWAKKAIADSKKFGDIHVAYDGSGDNFLS